MPTIADIPDLNTLTRLCVALGAANIGTITKDEQALIDAAVEATEPVQDALIGRARDAIVDGQDPLGDAFTTILNPDARRPLGQVFTPEPIVSSMVAWASVQDTPVRVVDPGAGSGRYLLAAARQFPHATLVGADIDPLSTLMLRANIAVAGLGDRTEVVLGDYRSMELPEADGPTLFIGNPPYVRHHQIAPEWKQWLATTAKGHGLKASGLAGLHVHFFLATLELGRPGDLGAFITSAEWLDTNYGSVVRQMLLGGLGGQSLHILEPKAAPFAGTNTTGAISCFKLGTKPDALTIRRVETVADLGTLDTGRLVSRQHLTDAHRWSPLSAAAKKIPEGYIELGELCRVHRGQATGANKIWATRDADIDLPDNVLFPSITRAFELFNAGPRLETSEALKRVIDIPVDLDELNDEDRKRVERFLRAAKKLGGHESYIARKRRAWWAVGLRKPAPILATYMARRPPAFVRNDINARHINIAHGLYPRQELDTLTLDRLADYLRTEVSLGQGRTYAGGLTKFEPKEMERLLVPTLDALREGVVAA